MIRIILVDRLFFIGGRIDISRPKNQNVVLLSEAE